MRVRAALTFLLFLSACGPSGTPDAGPGDAGPADAGQPDASRTLAAPLSCPAGSGEPVELLPLARLEAEGTLRAVVQWVREDTDGPMGLRDDAPETGWVAAPRGLGRLEVDLGPAVGRPIALDTLRLDYADAVPVRVSVLVLESCGGDVIVAREDVDPSMPIALEGACGTCVAIEVEDGRRGARLGGLSLTSRDPDLPAAPALPAPPSAPPVPRFADSGVVEGFYGFPWSFAERAQMIDTMSELGMGLYLYAPKDDPLHRSRWREPYPADFVADFRALADRAEERGVRLVFGVSPFLDFDGSEADLAALEAKLTVFLEAGADGIAILADDIEFEAEVTVDAALGATHATTTNRVRADLLARNPALSVLFVGTVYSDERIDTWPGGAAYLSALGALDPEVRVLWTGTRTSSPTLVGADLDRMRGLLGRKPLLWDNEWANDGGDGLLGRVFLGTYEGRDDALRDASLGVLANPMIQGGLSRLAVGHLGAWLDAVPVGAPARAASAALESRLALVPGDPTADAALLDFVSETFEGDLNRLPVHRPALRSLTALVDTVAGGSAPDAGEVETTLALLGRIAALRSEAHHATLEPTLGDELVDPLSKASAAAWEGFAALDLLVALAGTGDVAAARTALDTASAERNRASRFPWSEAELAASVDAVGALPARDLGLRAPPRSGAALPPCVAGEAMTFAPFAPGALVAVYGLPGAVADTGGRVTFTAPHPGRYLAVVTAQRTESPGGWASWRGVIVCRPRR
jgi:hypothetical protein